MFMSAKIKPSVDETIRRVLLNKPWHFNLEQSVCVCVCCVWRVLCKLQCKAVLPVKRKNGEGRTAEEPKIKEGGVYVQICLGSHVWWCESEGPSVGLLSPSWALIRLTFINLTGWSRQKHWH